MQNKEVWTKIIECLNDYFQGDSDVPLDSFISDMEELGYSVSFVPPNETKTFFIKVIEYLNQVAGTEYRTKYPSANSRLIETRRKEGYSLDDFKKVIDRKTSQWKGGPQEIYLRPETLFSAKHFENYIGEINRYGSIQQTNQGGFEQFASAVGEAAKQAGGSGSEGE